MGNPACTLSMYAGAPPSGSVRYCYGYDWRTSKEMDRKDPGKRRLFC